VNESERILLVEDEEAIAQGLLLNFDRKGWRTTLATDGQQALDLAEKHRFDVIVLDVRLPEVDGFEVCQRLRTMGDLTPILMLTARDQPDDIVYGLRLGADDYVTKPFEMPILVARVRAALRRAQLMNPAETLTLGPLRIDVLGHRVTRDDIEIELTPTEFRLLVELVRRPGQVFTREVLLDRVWGYSYLGDSRLVDVAIQRLRAKIEGDPEQPNLIETVRGVGYRAGR